MGAQPPGEPIGSGLGDSELEAVFARASPSDTLAAVLTEARTVLAEVDGPLDAELWGSDIVAAIGSADQADAIVTAARAADLGVIIMDPLTADWLFPRTRDGLHPTVAGDAWIARKVAAVLGQRGVRPAPPRAGAAGPVICDSGIPARPQAR